MVAENHVTSCDLRVFVDQAAEPITPQTRTWHLMPVDRLAGRRVLVQRPVWPVGCCGDRRTREDKPQMSFASDQHPVQAFAGGRCRSAFGDRVCAQCLDRCLDDADADGGEHGVERCRRIERATRSLPNQRGSSDARIAAVRGPP